MDHIDCQKNEFVKKVALAGAHNAAFQRSNVYSESADTKRKIIFVESFKQALSELGDKYVNDVSESDHIKNIDTFRHKLSLEFGDVLMNNAMNVGVAQKALNCYLKYLWSFGMIVEPPHCPIDSMVLRRAGIQGTWTRLNSIDVYVDWIDKIKDVAGPNMSIAKWELISWNEEFE